MNTRLNCSGMTMPSFGNLTSVGGLLTEQAARRPRRVARFPLDHVLQVAEVHLLVGLLAPADRLLRVGVGGVLVAVVVPRGVDQRAAARRPSTGSAKRYCSCQLKS